jgi:general secretion pathway protein C
MTSRLLSLLVWALVGATGVFWGLKLFSKGSGLPPSVAMPASAVVGGDLSKLLGDSAAAEAEDTPEVAAGSDRFHLVGVVAPTGRAASTQGVALIAIADQPAKAWKTGAVIEGDWVLLSVGRRSAQIGPRGGPATAEISLPALTPPAVGSLPVAKMGMPSSSNSVPGLPPGALFNRMPGAIQGTPPAGVLPQPAPPMSEDPDE